MKPLRRKINDLYFTVGKCIEPGDNISRDNFMEIRDLARIDLNYLHEYVDFFWYDVIMIQDNLEHTLYYWPPRKDH